MHIHTALALLVAGIAAAGCATQQTPDSQTGEMTRQLETVRQQQSSLSTAQKTLESRMAALESGQASLVQSVAKAQETADDAIKIARDSRSVAGKVVDTLTLSEDMVSYNYENPELTAKGKAALDSLIERTRPLMPHAFIEIIGFTDSVGLSSHNSRIALERAESVRRYLRETGGFPLHRMSSISYGDLQPLAANETLQGRSQNRRVVVQVLK
jgi:outer membrane protein OmpA-like peptidoglycan-associated protein